MFNAVSRQKCRQIIASEFPELQDFIDMLYLEEGTTRVRKDDGTWETIPVREGFSQGCPASPFFAALVLNYILHKVNNDLMKLATNRKRNNHNLDDDRGGIPLIMAYIDDVNALVPTQDVKLFLDLFEKYGKPLGAVLNTEKTRIMTSTSNKSTSTSLLASGYPFKREIGASLSTAISLYSRKKTALQPKLQTDSASSGRPSDPSHSADLSSNQHSIKRKAIASRYSLNSRVGKPSSNYFTAPAPNIS